MRYQTKHFLIHHQQLALIRDALVVLKFKIKNELDYANRHKNPLAKEMQYDLERVQKLLENTKIENLDSIISLEKE